MSKVINVSLSGGFGTRLWPLSTPKNPKQIFKIFNGKSLFRLIGERSHNFIGQDLILNVATHCIIATYQVKKTEYFFGH